MSEFSIKVAMSGSLKKKKIIFVCAHNYFPCKAMFKIDKLHVVLTMPHLEYCKTALLILYKHYIYAHCIITYSTTHLEC